MSDFLDYNNVKTKGVISKIKYQGDKGVLGLLNFNDLSILLKNSKINWNKYKGIVIYGCNYGSAYNGIYYPQGK